MSLLQEIALEMSIKTGQVYTCPAENLIQGPDHAYWIRPRTWPKPERLAVDWTGPDNYSPFKTDTITLNPQRKPEAIARDILNRLPPDQAAAYYTRAAEHHAAKMEKERNLKASQDFFTSLQMKPYWNDRGAEKYHKGDFAVEFTSYEPRVVKLILEKLTPEQAAQVMEYTKTIQTTQAKGQ